jgi:hypothetical protein
VKVKDVVARHDNNAAWALSSIPLARALRECAMKREMTEGNNREKTSLINVTINWRGILLGGSSFRHRIRRDPGCRADADANGGIRPAFWSLTMYVQRQLPAANPINRYAIGDRDKLTFNPDGSLDLQIQRESLGEDKESSWLPALKRAVHDEPAPLLA